MAEMADTLAFLVLIPESRNNQSLNMSCSFGDVVPVGARSVRLGTAAPGIPGIKIVMSVNIWYFHFAASYPETQVPLNKGYL